MKEICPIAEIDHKITMKEIGPISKLNCKNTMTKINHAEWTDHQSITKMIMKEGIIIHFRTLEIGENTNIIIKTSIGMKISMIVIDTDNSQGIDRACYRNRSYSRDRLQDYCRDVYKEENHKYKRRSRDYYEDAYKDRYNRNKYKHQYRNESYNLSRDKSRENSMNAMQGKPITFQNLN